MKPVVLIEQENVTIPLDQFHAELDAAINDAQRIWCPRGLNCDWLGDAMAFGLTVYPPAVYEKIRQLKEQSDGNRPSSRVE